MLAAVATDPPHVSSYFVVIATFVAKKVLNIWSFALQHLSKCFPPFKC